MFSLFTKIIFHNCSERSTCIPLPLGIKVICILIDSAFPMEIKCFFDTKQQVITKRKNFSYSIDSLGGKILMGKILITYSITYSKTGFAYHIEIGFLFVPNFVLLIYTMTFCHVKIIVIKFPMLKIDF